MKIGFLVGKIPLFQRDFYSMYFVRIFPDKSDTERFFY